MTGPLPIEVTPTYPPSQAVRILGTELYIGPAHADADQLVLICFTTGRHPVIHAVHGPPSQAGTPLRPAIPPDASPVALVRLLRASACVLASNITLLTPDGNPAVRP